MHHRKPSTEELRATAFHEAGHAVIAVALGWSINYVSIRPDRTRRYSGTTALRTRKQHLPIHFYEKIQILSAGFICQSRSCPAPPEFLKMDARHDFDEIEKLSIEILRKVEGRDVTWHPGTKVMEELLARVSKKVHFLFDDPGIWRAVIAVAENLLKCGRLSGGMVNKICDDSLTVPAMT